ncbi:hypothetical protein OA259_01400 [SAR86 cluster bacterium]|nr:hypothetical protein [SAR86 cluster bacterium]
MKLFVNYLFLVILSSMLISCGGGSSNSNEAQIEINTQASTDSSSQNTQSDTKKVIEEIPTFENSKFDEAIYN